jgi:hypothetical protein
LEVAAVLFVDATGEFAFAQVGVGDLFDERREIAAADGMQAGVPWNVNDEGIFGILMRLVTGFPALGSC